MKKSTKKITALTVQQQLESVKPPLTKQQQLVAIATAIQKKQMANKLAYEETIKKETENLQAQITELIKNNLCIWKVEMLSTGFDGTPRINIRLEGQQELGTIIKNLHNKTCAYPRVQDLHYIIQELKKAQAATFNSQVAIDKLLSSPEVCAKLAAFGNELLNKSNDAKAITL